MALLRAAKAIDGLKNLEGDEKVGAMIVKRALEAPIGFSRSASDEPPRSHP